MRELRRGKSYPLTTLILRASRLKGNLMRIYALVWVCDSTSNSQGLKHSVHSMQMDCSLATRRPCCSRRRFKMTRLFITYIWRKEKPFSLRSCSIWVLRARSRPFLMLTRWSGMEIKINSETKLCYSILSSWSSLSIREREECIGSMCRTMRLFARLLSVLWKISIDLFNPLKSLSLLQNPPHDSNLLIPALSPFLPISLDSAPPTLSSAFLTSPLISIFRWILASCCHSPSHKLTWRPISTLRTTLWI